MVVFVRKDGVVGGVCGGLADRLKVAPWAMRLIFLLLTFVSFGTSLLVYFAAVLSFPNLISLRFGDRPQFLGVCHKLAPKLKVHESWLRFFVLLVCIATAVFPVLIFYLVVFLFLNLSFSNAKPFKDQNPSGVRDVN